MLNAVLKHIEVVVCKKRLQKTANDRKMRPILKLPKWPPSKGFTLCKIVTLTQKLKTHNNI